ncbi:MAG TPA: hypothetical protein VII64_02525 [Thermodesulfobacteriota bacterium]
MDGIVIKAKDEYSGAFESLGKKTRTAVDEVNSSLERLQASRGLERFSSSASTHISGVSKAFGELKKAIDEVPEVDPSGKGRNGETAGLTRLKEENRRYIDEKAGLALEERALSRSHLAETEEMERLSWATRLAYAQSASAMLSNTMQNLFIATGSKNKAMFEAMKAFALAETLIQTYRAAQGAYAALAPIPIVGPALGAAAAAAAIAAGLARAEQIRSTDPKGATSSIGAGGRANPQYSGGSPSAYPVPTRIENERPTQVITIYINNPLSEQNWQKIVEDNIVPAIKEAGDRNVSLKIRGMEG